MAETVGQRKVVGAVWLIVAIVSIGAAVAVQPVSDWGLVGIVLAILLGVLGISGAWMLATGRGSINGSSTSPRTQMVLSIIGIVASTLLVGIYLLGDWDNWTAFDVLSIGVWVSLGAMFIEGLIASRRRA